MAMRDSTAWNLRPRWTILSAQTLESCVTAATVLYKRESETRVDDALVEGDGLWLRLPDLIAASEWELKPEGVRKDEICVPVPGPRKAALIRDEPAGTGSTSG